MQTKYFTSLDAQMIEEVTGKVSQAQTQLDRAQLYARHFREAVFSTDASSSTGKTIWGGMLESFIEAGVAHYSFKPKSLKLQDFLQLLGILWMQKLK